MLLFGLIWVQTVCKYSGRHKEEKTVNFLLFHNSYYRLHLFGSVCFGEINEDKLQFCLKL